MAVLLLFLSLLFVTLVSAESENSCIPWVLKNGGFLHPNLEYRDGGMFATGLINRNELLASIPKSLEFPCPGTIEECLISFKEEMAKGVTSKWWPYLKSLPTTCQNKLCEDIDKSDFTIAGFDALKDRWPNKMDIEASILMSRRWGSGLRPMLDLFNHHYQAYYVDEPSETTNELHLNTLSAEVKQEMADVLSTYYLFAHQDYILGDQVYTRYNDNRIWDNSVKYGFFEINDRKLECEDMYAMRLGAVVDRVACWSDLKGIRIENLLDEMKEALKYEDFALIKGAAQSIVRDIVYETREE
jgi:hypothetical protein